MEFFIPCLDVITTVLYLASVAILLWGVILCVRDFLTSHFRQMGRTERMKKLADTKNSLGGYILLALEVLIVADIIDSIAKPTFEDILRLAAIVAIRTVISYFLNKEIRDSEQQEALNGSDYKEKKRSEQNE
ncbi:DUF1622 domain-containing protein [Christensenella tenuis]|jgi:uncharacterized membrane protein|uniref:DUF1622 domain-containing protein n=1 Tax=Christensenella tenuis TaxID=2763033 RepID=A0ABR7EJV7_9FIRM|nr:DUF1622 domain-containing protein [Christensenella tenuis]MBC5649438.1 DUF1622 domain-containing protein [Christensenella tenuis]